MPDNPIPATKTESEAAAGEFNFTQPETENPRIKRRSLKAKPAGLIKPTASALPAARELEREAPPRTPEPATKAAPAAKPVQTTGAPPKVTPTASAAASAAVKPTTASTPVATSAASSPHGTRPATLYYSSTTPKAATPSPMKTIPTASSLSSTTSASSAAASSASVTRPVTASASRPSPNVDYRANVERQSREQKSVGSILSYVVYGLIAFFVITAGLAAYGADIIFKQLHDQSATVSDLDAHYTKVTKDLDAKLSATQATLGDAQAQIARQQDLIVKQQEAINQLISSSASNDSAIKAERQTRAQDEASLRSRIKDLEYRTSTQKY